MTAVHNPLLRNGPPSAELPACRWREPTRSPGVYYCRHAAVHTKNDLVDATICRTCEQSQRYPLLPRPFLADPLKPRQSYEASPLWQYISLERLACDVRQLVSQLPSDLSGVAGIPRSGMLPASQIALLLHLPLWELCPRRGLRPIGHGQRL